MLQFDIPGEPKGKARPRFARMGGHVRTFTPKETESYENLVKLCARMHMNGAAPCDDGALRMQVKAYFSIPKSFSNKKHQAAIQGALLPTKKPDADNILKIIADALNGIVYRDDAQIAAANVEKHYSTTPRVEVCLWKL